MAIEVDASKGTMEAVTDVEQVTLVPIGATMSAKVKYAGGGLTVVGKASLTSDSLKSFLGEAATIVDNVHVTASADTATGAWEVQGRATGTPDKVLGLLPASLRTGITASDVTIPVSIKKQAGDSSHSVQVGDLEACVGLRRKLGALDFAAQARVSKKSGSPVALHSKGSLSVSVGGLPTTKLDVLLSCCPLRAYGNGSLVMNVPGSDALLEGGLDVNVALEGTFDESGSGSGGGFSFAAAGVKAVTLPRLPMQTAASTVDLRVVVEMPAGGALSVKAEADAVLNFAQSSPVRKISGKVTVARDRVEVDGLVDMKASIPGIDTEIDVPAIPVKVIVVDRKMVARVDHTLQVPIFPSEWGVGEATVNVNYDSDRDPRLHATAAVDGTLDLQKFLPGQSFLGAIGVSVSASSTNGVSFTGSATVDVAGRAVPVTISGDPTNGLSLYGSLDADAELLDFGPLSSVGLDKLRLSRIWVSVASPNKRSRSASSTQFIAGVEGSLGKAPFAGLISISKDVCATGEITLSEVDKLQKLLGVSLGSEPLRVHYCNNYQALRRMKDAASALQASAIPSVTTGMLRRLQQMLAALPDVAPKVDVSLSIRMPAKRGTVGYKALDFCRFREKHLTLSMGLNTATGAATLGVDLPSVNLKLGGYVKAFEFKLALVTSGLRIGGTPSVSFQLQVLRLQLKIEDTNLEYSGLLSASATGEISGALQMRDPVLMPYLGRRVGIIIPDPVNNPLTMSFSYHPITMELGIGMASTAILSADKTVRVTSGDPDAGRREQEACSRRALCSTVALDFSTKLDCKPLAATGSCSAFAAEIDLKMATGKIGLPLVLQAVLDRDLPNSFHTSADKLLGTLGPLHLKAKNNWQAPWDTEFEMRAAQQPAGGTGFAFTTFAQFSRSSGIVNKMVLSNGCVGVVVGGGCNGLHLDPSDVGEGVWNDIYRVVTRAMPSVGSRHLPDSINSASKAGPAFDVELGLGGVKIEGRASAKFTAALMPGLDGFLPSASVYLLLTPQKLKFDGTFSKPPLDISAGFDIDVFPSPGVRELYLEFSMRRFLDAVKQAIKSISGTVYELLNFMGAFSSIALKSMGVMYRGGGDATFKLSMTLFGDDINPQITLPVQKFVDTLKALVRGDVDCIKQFIDLAWKKIEDFAGAVDPCTCRDSCYGRAKPTVVTRMVDTQIDCPKVRDKETCGRSLVPCGCTATTKWEHIETIDVPYVECSTPTCDSRRRRRWVTGVQCRGGGCKTVWKREEIWGHVPYCEDNRCCWTVPEPYIGKCTVQKPEVTTHTRGNLAMRRRECTTVSKIHSFPVPCAWNLALDRFGIPGLPGLEQNKHC